MNKKFHFILEPYKLGGSTKHQCPKCGRKKCFTRYVRVETGEYVDELCGKCDHDNSCGYHYRPSEFFRDHPDYKYVRDESRPLRPVQPRSLKPQKEFIAEKWVERSHQKASVFFQWLDSICEDKALVQKAFDDYRLGALREGEVVFWQIDALGNVHEGKIMAYGKDGHRSQTQHPDWMGTKFGMQIGLTDGFRNQRQQCLFGEHLVAQRPDDVVCLVESEKTAIICSLYSPQYVWVATGGCGQLNIDKLRPLQHRRLVIFPDSGEYDYWSSKMKELKRDYPDIIGSIDYTIDRNLEAYPPNTDLADLLLA